MIFIVKDVHNEQRDRVSTVIVSRTLQTDHPGADDRKTRHEHSHEPAYSERRREWQRYRRGRHRQDEAVYLVLQGVCLTTLIPWGTVLTFIERKCAPRLSAEAQEMLSSHFVSLRKQVQQVERDNDERSSIPITIRSVVFIQHRGGNELIPHPVNSRPSFGYPSLLRSSRCLQSFRTIMSKRRSGYSSSPPWTPSPLEVPMGSPAEN